MIKFRGYNTVEGKTIYWSFSEFVHSKACALDPDSVRQYVCEVANGELYDGDEIRIDFDKAAPIVGEGLMLSTIKATKPTAEAKLYVEYSHYRYRLIWRTPNGRFETELDLALISNILECVEVVR